jgi:D-cysteine desulfhydrase
MSMLSRLVDAHKRVELTKSCSRVYEWIGEAKLRSNFASTLGSVWIKRDDENAAPHVHSFAAGNKLRKLEYLMSDALSRQADIVLTIGGVQSNHCRSTALVSAQLGLDCALVLRTPNLARANAGNTFSQGANVMLNSLNDARMYLCSPSEYARHGQAELLERAARRLETEHAYRRVYRIPVGGSVPLGTLGFVRAAAELDAQFGGGRPWPVDDVAIATGSGGSLAGLALGMHLLDARSESGERVKLHGYAACDSEQYFVDHANWELGALLDGEQDVPRAEHLFRVVERSRGLGYGRSTDDELSTLLNVARRTGVMLDPTYTAKAVHTMLGDSALSGRRVLFWHTGGALGTFDRAKVDQMQPLASNEISTLL